MAGGDDAATAAEILGAHVADDAALSAKRVAETDGPFVSQKVVLALAEGWPDRAVFTQVVRHVRDAGTDVTHTALVRLLADNGDTTRIAEEFATALAGCERAEHGIACMDCR